MKALAAEQAALTTRLLGGLTEPQRHAVQHSFDGPARTMWAYQPRPRPGVALHDLAPPARKTVHRLLAGVLSRHAFTQACMIMALEEVLDADEHGRRDRHSDDYRIVVFGTPGEAVWAWRLEGHHLSVTTVIAGTAVTLAPLFLGANPARVADSRGRVIVAPLATEEDLARALLTALPTHLRDRAIIAQIAPPDLRSGTQSAIGAIEPAGVAAAQLPDPARTCLRDLVGVYLDRLAPPLAAAEHHRIDWDTVHLAWEGSTLPGEGHYYRIQANGLLLEYDNPYNGANHAHTVLRRPGEDFGTHLLTSHRATETP